MQASLAAACEEALRLQHLLQAEFDALKVQDQATKHCKYAISALQYSDVGTAISNLEAALRCLRAARCGRRAALARAPAPLAAFSASLGQPRRRSTGKRRPLSRAPRCTAIKLW